MSCPSMATNFIPWIPVQFFTNAAIRLLANAGYTAGALTSTSNLLVDQPRRRRPRHQPPHPALADQLLHPERPPPLAARRQHLRRHHQPNPATRYPYLPLVFRPVFLTPNNGNQVFLYGYREVTSFNQLANALLGQVFDLTSAKDRSTIGRVANAVAWNVPLVIGAKKGFPNFNNSSMQTAVQFTRKLEFVRQGFSATTAIAQTNQMYVMGISNIIGIGAWNSYSNYFPRGLGLTVHSSTTACVSNILGAQSYPIWNYTTNLSVGPLALAPNSWPGYIDQNHSANSVLIPLWTNFLTLTNSQYLQKTAPPTSCRITATPSSGPPALRPPIGT